MGNQISQAFPPEAKLTEKNLPDQTGKVFIVTGSSSGVGKELAQVLYSHNAKVYLAARSEEKTNAAIESIKAAFPNSKGKAIYLHLYLDDLTTIKASANDFLSKEDKLNVLFNNAGVMVPPQGSKTKQGYELQLGTNNLAPFLFTKLLTPILIKTAKLEPPGTVRVVWTSSSAAEAMSPKNGVSMDNLDYKVDKTAWHKYGVSKAGNVLHAKEYANRYKGDGLISVVGEVMLTGTGRDNSAYGGPGTQPRKSQDSTPTPCTGLADGSSQRMLHTPIHGAYTELFASLSPDVTQDHNGAWIIPWGRIAPIRKDLEAAGKSEKDGGTGVAAKFWEWTEEQIKPYL